MENGTHQAKVKDYGFKFTKNGTIQIAVVFENDVGQCLTWFGSLNEGRALSITLDSLALLGYKGQDIDLLNEGVASNILDINKKVLIKVEEEFYNRKPIKKVKWINESGNSFERLDSNQLRAMLNNSNVKGQIAQRFGNNSNQSFTQSANNFNQHQQYQQQNFNQSNQMQNSPFNASSSHLPF